MWFVTLISIPWIIQEFIVKTSKLATDAILAKSRAAYFTAREKRSNPWNHILQKRACVFGEMEIFQTRPRRKRFEAETWMSLSHGIVRVLFVANDIISGTTHQPAAPIDLVLERAIANVHVYIYRHTRKRTYMHPPSSPVHVSVRVYASRSIASESFRRGGR